MIMLLQRKLPNGAWIDVTDGGGVDNPEDLQTYLRRRKKTGHYRAIFYWHTDEQCFINEFEIVNDEHYKVVIFD